MTNNENSISSLIVYFAFADFEESRKNNAHAKEIYEVLLKKIAQEKEARKTRLSSEEEKQLKEDELQKKLLDDEEYSKKCQDETLVFVMYMKFTLRTEVTSICDKIIKEKKKEKRKKNKERKERQKNKK